MTNSEELMIGNYLFDGAGRLCQVDKLHGWGFSAPAIKGATTTIRPAHSGIHLTPEILTEWCLAACDNGKPNQYRFGERLIVIRNGIFFDYGSGVKLEYLHEFQNFYYWNSGKQQLTIKLPNNE